MTLMLRMRCGTANNNNNNNNNSTSTNTNNNAPATSAASGASNSEYMGLRCSMFAFVNPYSEEVEYLVCTHTCARALQQAAAAAAAAAAAGMAESGVTVPAGGPAPVAACAPPAGYSNYASGAAPASMAASCHTPTPGPSSGYRFAQQPSGAVPPQSECFGKASGVTECISGWPCQVASRCAMRVPYLLQGESRVLMQTTPTPASKVEVLCLAEEACFSASRQCEIPC